MQHTPCRSLRGWPLFSDVTFYKKKNQEDCTVLQVPHSARQARSLASRWGTGHPRPTGPRRLCAAAVFTEDTWGRLLPKDPGSAHDSSPGISMWITALHLDPVRFCLCLFCFFGWTFAANGTYSAKCWLLGSPCVFVNLNEKGRGGRGKQPQFRFQPLAGAARAERDRLAGCCLRTLPPVLCAV